MQTRQEQPFDITEYFKLAGTGQHTALKEYLIKYRPNPHLRDAKGRTILEIFKNIYEFDSKVRITADEEIISKSDAGTDKTPIYHEEKTRDHLKVIIILKVYGVSFRLDFSERQRLGDTMARCDELIHAMFYLLLDDITHVDAFHNTMYSSIIDTHSNILSCSKYLTLYLPMLEEMRHYKLHIQEMNKTLQALLIPMDLINLVGTYMETPCPEYINNLEASLPFLNFASTKTKSMLARYGTLWSFNLLNLYPFTPPNKRDYNAHP